MIGPTSPAIVDLGTLLASRCVVCGGKVADGEGFMARYRDQTVRLRCLDCLTRFLADPDRYLTGHSNNRCEGAEPSGSPASEWACD